MSGPWYECVGPTAEEVRKDVQVNMLDKLIDADTKLIDDKHSGKFISNLKN